MQSIYGNPGFPPHAAFELEWGMNLAAARSQFCA
jgi:hypothetical protein